MPLLCPIDHLRGRHELVICDSENSRRAHQELFRFRDEDYLVADEDNRIFDVLVSISLSCSNVQETCPSRMHIVLGWENILKVCSWKAEKPSTGDVFTILKAAGVSSEDLLPFQSADINDMFPWLYYGKRFDVLRKICHSAKRRLEGHMKNHSVRADCHLIADDSKRIVASSL